MYWLNAPFFGNQLAQITFNNNTFINLVQKRIWHTMKHTYTRKEIQNRIILTAFRSHFIYSNAKRRPSLNNGRHIDCKTDWFNDAHRLILIVCCLITCLSDCMVAYLNGCVFDWFFGYSFEWLAIWLVAHLNCSLTAWLLI